MSNKLNIHKKAKKMSDRERIAVLEKMVTANHMLITKLYNALEANFKPDASQEDK